MKGQQAETEVDKGELGKIRTLNSSWMSLVKPLS